MTPELRFSFSIDITVSDPVVIYNNSRRGKRQLIPILDGTVSGAIEGNVLPGGVDSQIIGTDGVCRLSARYALQVHEGAVYIQNDGIRRIPDEFRDKLFGSDMSFFSTLSPADIYFRTVPTFEVDSPALEWLTTSVFICSASRSETGVKLGFYRVE